MLTVLSWCKGIERNNDEVIYCLYIIYTGYLNLTDMLYIYIQYVYVAVLYIIHVLYEIII